MNNSDNNQKEPHSTQSMGKGMYIVAWLMGLGLLTLFFSGHEKKRYNPNQNPESMKRNGQIEVTLKQNRRGHYITNGTINGESVVFLLDTGATEVSIPEHLANDLGLKKGRPFQIKTANGNATAYESWVEQLSIGDIKLHDVDAHINPGMKDDFILLGMSALKQLEFAQRDKTLTLRTY